MSLLIQKIEYQGQTHIRVQPIEFVPGLTQKMRQIPGAFWQPGPGWLIPYRKEAYGRLKVLFGLEYIKLATIKER